MKLVDVFPTSDPGIIAGAEQDLAATDEAARLAPHNGSLHDDPKVEEIIRRALRGRNTAMAEFDAHLPEREGLVAPHIRVVVAHCADEEPDVFAHEVPAVGPVTIAAAAPCVVCGNSKRVTARYLTFWVACGWTIVELVMCRPHAEHYIDRYGAVSKDLDHGAV